MGAAPEELEIHERLKAQGVLGRLPLNDESAVRSHLAPFPYRKAAMDATRERRPNRERRAQQDMVWLHSAADGEFLVCDIEYAFKYWDEKRRTGRIDMVAARRLDQDSADKSRQLALIELKYGANAMDGVAGLQKHVRDLHGLMALDDLGARADEIAHIVDQKRTLGLLDAFAPVFDPDAPLLYMIALAAHRPRSQRLRDALLGCVDRGENRLTWPEGVDARVAILDQDLLLDSSSMLACDEISAENVPASIFCGRKLKDRRPRVWRCGLPGKRTGS